MKVVELREALNFTSIMPTGENFLVRRESSQRLFITATILSSENIVGIFAAVLILGMKENQIPRDYRAQKYPHPFFTRKQTSRA